jgi:hypothetical protein
MTMGTLSWIVTEFRFWGVPDVVTAHTVMCGRGQAG